MKTLRNYYVTADARTRMWLAVEPARPRTILDTDHFAEPNTATMMRETAEIDGETVALTIYFIDAPRAR